MTRIKQSVFLMNVFLVLEYVGLMVGIIGSNIEFHGVVHTIGFVTSLVCAPFIFMFAVISALRMANQ